MLAELSFRDLVPADLAAQPELRAERERRGGGLHLVKHRAILNTESYASLIASASVPMADLFGVAGRGSSRLTGFHRALAEVSVRAEPRADRRSRSRDRSRSSAGCAAPAPIRRDMPRFAGRRPRRGIGSITGFTIAAEIGDIYRSSSKVKLTGIAACARECRRPCVGSIAAVRGEDGRQILALGAEEARSPLPHTHSSRSAISAPSAGWAASAARRSPRSSSPASSPRRSGTC